MTVAQRFLSFSILGILCLAFAPLASAAEHPEIDPALRTEIRSAMRECREQETREEKRECVESVREQYKGKLPERGRRNHGRRHNPRRRFHFIRDLSQEEREQIREDLTECRELHRSGAERNEVRACIEAVKDKYTS